MFGHFGRFADHVQISSSFTFKHTEELTHACPGRFIAWCKQEQASLEQQLEMMESGKVRTGEDIGSGWIDTTEQSIERAKARLAELNELLTEEGTASVIKPSDL